MAHFAKIENNIVTAVIVAEPEFINAGYLGPASFWIQTSYNTRGGVHYGPDGQPDGVTPLRKNYAGIGYTYDTERDAFIPPKPYASWILNEDTCLWDPPVPMPDPSTIPLDHWLMWNEETQTWDIKSITDSASPT